MAKKQIIILLGSTKTTSINLKLVEYFTQKTSDLFETMLFPIADLPFFNPDLDGIDLPVAVQKFRQAIEKADGVLISTPEYVFSLPGILKNALEWAVSTMVFEKKPTAFITAATSGEATHASLRLILKTIGAETSEKMAILMPVPKSKMDENGDISDGIFVQLFENLIFDFHQKIIHLEP
jgi:chromate reductase, NAD(P)H dehydrogenase (quinone)